MSGTEAARSARDAAVLQSVTAALSGAHDVQSVARVICEIARTGIGAAGCFVARFDADTMVMLGTGGLTRPTASAYAVLPLDAPLPPMEALRTRRPVTVRTRAERDVRFPAISDATDDHGSFIALPMLDRTRVVGVVNFSWREEGGCDGVSEPQLLALASQCGQALERARLYDAEQQARRSAEAAVDQLQMLQSLTARLSSAPDGRAVASTILDTLLRVLGGAEGAVYRVDEIEDGLQLLGSRAVAQTFDEFVPLGDHGPAAEAARTNTTIPPLVPPFVPGRRSEMVWTPLHLGGRPVGVIAMAGHDRTVAAAYDPTFISTVIQLFAQALERAELFDTSHDIALTLQNSMLPRRLPVIQGLEIAVRYRPVGGRTVVGGDFYDVFRVGPGRWGVVIGDVSGKGVRAASLTALARYTVRAVAGSAEVPSDVLGALNTAVLDWEDGEDRFCTAAYLDVEPGPGGAAVRLAVGGHPLPVLRTAAGLVDRVGQPGMALGLLPLAEVNDASVSLAPGDVLVLVTDGITEARTATGTWVEDAVDRALAVGLGDAGEDAESIADRIERIVLDVQGGRPRDDLAVVVLRAPTDASNAAVEAVSMSLTLECEARSVAVARRRVAELLGDRASTSGAEILELLVSEVVTNAVVHARSAVGVRVAVAADRAHVEVTDSSPSSPMRRDARMDSLGGRGLLLLDRLAAAWGVRRQADGKIVWFDVDL